MKSCPNCGWSNEEQNRFCENCGADFEGLRAQGKPAGGPTSTWQATPPASDAPPAPRNRWEIPPAAPDWRMAPLPPEEEPGKRGRRIWLWVISGILLGCMLLCVVSVFAYTQTGWGEDLQTSVSERATESGND